MGKAVVGCPGCGLAAARNNGHDRQGRQIHQCCGCERRFTARSATPFAGYRFPPDVIALAVRWYLRYRLSYADVAELDGVPTYWGAGAPRAGPGFATVLSLEPRR